MCTSTVYILLYTLYVYRGVSIGGVCIGGVCVGACIYVQILKNLSFGRQWYISVGDFNHL